MIILVEEEEEEEEEEDLFFGSGVLRPSIRMRAWTIRSIACSIV